MVERDRRSLFQGILLLEAADEETSTSEIACLQTRCVVLVISDWTMMMKLGTYGLSHQILLWISQKNHLYRPLHRRDRLTKHTHTI
jgi:hypothetical protein